MIFNKMNKNAIKVNHILMVKITMEIFFFLNISRLIFMGGIYSDRAFTSI